jgi:hypothetical protein
VSVVCVSASCLPTRIQWMVVQARLGLMVTGSLAVILQVYRNPPPDNQVCAEYADQRAQGSVALLAIAVLILSNRAAAFGIALSALMGVGDFASAAVPLSLCAAYVACNAQLEVLTLLLFSVYTLAHAIHCHNDARHESTHATVLATIVIWWHFSAKTFVACTACCVRPLRTLRRNVRTKAASRPNPNRGGARDCPPPPSR